MSDKEDKKLEPRNDWSEEERQNVIGFFDLLIKVDRRNNPHLYKNEDELKGEN